MNNFAGVNDHAGGRIERIDVGNRTLEIAHSPIGVRHIQRDIGIGDLRDDRSAGR
jgi:hypothetical protein